MTDRDYPKNYYSDGMTLPAPRPTAQGEIACENCIVGGGIAGIMLARDLAAAKKDVILLEGSRLGWGASGRNGGFVVSGWAEGLAAIEARVGLEQAKALQALSFEGLEMVRSAIQVLDHGLLEGRGYLSLARHDDEEGLKRERDYLARHYGQELTYLSRAEVQERVHSPRYHQGLLDNSAFHVQALALCLALAADAEKSGARFHETSPVVSFERPASAWHIRTAQAKITCRNLVLCSGGYGGAEMGRLARGYLPISTYLILTEPLGEPLEKAIATGSALADRRRAGNYFRKAAGGRLLWGGDITAFGLERPAEIGEKLKRDARSVFPQLGDFRIEAAWGGRMAYARHKMPIVGPLDGGLWACCGFGGHGMNTGPICARLVAEGVTGASDRYRLLSPFGPSWNGGFLGPLAAEVIFRGMKLRDAWQERSARGSS